MALTQEDLLYELDRIKRRGKIEPGEWRDKLPSAIPNLPPDLPGMSSSFVNSVRGLSNAATKEQSVLLQNKRDFEAMVKAEKALNKAKKQLGKTKRPVIEVPVGQPNFVTQPYKVPVKPNKMPSVGGGGTRGGKPINTSGPGFKDPTPLRGVSTSNVTSVRWRGHTLNLNPSAVNNFVGFLNELAATGYNIQTIGSHAVRNIAGTNTPSLHSYGLAIDINPTQNPVTWNGIPKTNLPKGVGRLAAKYGLVWGGNWNGSKTDAMHFSIPYAGTK